MPIRDAKGLRWPALILGAALAIFASALVVSNWYQWRILALPVDLKLGVTRSAEFRVDQNVNYLVELEVERNIPFDELNCMIGESRKPCSVKPVDIHWRLLNGPKEMAAGSSGNQTGGGYGTTITKTLGRFEGSPRTPYTLEVISFVDGSALAPANPRIVVQVHPMDYKGHYVIAQLMVMGAIGIAAGGLIWLLVWGVRAYVVPRKS